MTWRSSFPRGNDYGGKSFRHRNVWNCYIEGMIHWPVGDSGKVLARLSKFCLRNTTKQILHRDDICKQNYVSRKYSVSYSALDSLQEWFRHMKDYIYQRSILPFGSQVNITTTSDRSWGMKWECVKVNGSFIMFHFAFVNFYI